VHLLATDRLTCPRCGPEFGLILLAHQTVGERRVLEAELGCANCRDRFPVRGGFGDLRAPPRGDLPPSRMPSERAPDEAPVSEGVADDAGEGPDPGERYQALLNLVQGPGLVAMVGASARWAPALADRVEDVEVFAVDAGTAAWEERPGVTRLVAAPGLPIFPGSLRGVVVDGELGHRWIGEAVRVLAPRNRLVVEAAPDGTAERLEGAGLKVLAEDHGTLVAARD